MRGPILCMALLLVLGPAFAAPQDSGSSRISEEAPTLVPVPRPNPARLQREAVTPRFYAGQPAGPATLCPLPYAGSNYAGTIPGSGSGSAVYGSTYGENYGGGMGSTLDQSSAVLGAPCMTRAPSPDAQPGSGVPWQEPTPSLSYGATQSTH